MLYANVAIPTIALEQEIKKQVEENPVLEDTNEAVQDSNIDSSSDENNDTLNWNDNYDSRDFKNNEN